MSNQEESQQRMEWKTIEDVNDMHAGINDEDNRNKCDNEEIKVHRKEEMGGINNDTHATHIIKIFFLLLKFPMIWLYYYY